jgi:hypothetical protein
VVLPELPLLPVPLDEPLLPLLPVPLGLELLPEPPAALEPLLPPGLVSLLLLEPAAPLPCDDELPCPPAFGCAFWSAGGHPASPSVSAAAITPSHLVMVLLLSRENVGPPRRDFTPGELSHARASGRRGHPRAR